MASTRINRLGCRWPGHRGRGAVLQGPTQPVVRAWRTFAAAQTRRGVGGGTDSRLPLGATVCAVAVGRRGAAHCPVPPWPTSQLRPRATDRPRSCPDASCPPPRGANGHCTPACLRGGQPNHSCAVWSLGGGEGGCGGGEEGPLVSGSWLGRPCGAGGCCPTRCGAVSGSWGGDGDGLGSGGFLPIPFGSHRHHTCKYWQDAAGRIAARWLCPPPPAPFTRPTSHKHSPSASRQFGVLGLMGASKGSCAGSQFAQERASWWH